LPDLRSHLQDLPDPVEGDPASQRHRLHSAVLDLLTAVGQRRPVLLVLDDLHWADRPSLLALEPLPRAPGDAPLPVGPTHPAGAPPPARARGPPGRASPPRWPSCTAGRASSGSPWAALRWPRSSSSSSASAAGRTAGRSRACSAT